MILTATTPSVMLLNAQHPSGGAWSAWYYGARVMREITGLHPVFNLVGDAEDLITVWNDRLRGVRP